MKKIMLLIMCLSVFPLAAEQQVRSIEIEGLKRTSRETFYRIIKLREGDNWDGQTPEILEQRLRQAGIFQSEITVEVYEEDEVVDLYIEAYDKWTLLVFPLYTVSQGESSGGAFLVDSNAFGKKHLFVFSGIFSKNSRSFFSLYQIPKINGSDFTYLQSVLYTSDRVVLKNIEGNRLLGSFDRDFIGSSGRVSYHFSDRFDMGFQTGVFYRNLSNLNNIDAQNGSYYEVPVGLRIEWADETLYPLFKQGISLQSDSQYSLGARPYFKEEVKLWAALRPQEWLEVSLEGLLYYSTGEVNTFLLMGEKTGHYTLPDEEVASSFVTAGQLASEFRLISLGFGSITMPVFYEAGRFLSIEDQFQFYHGAGAGLRFYIDKVAVPAMGLEYHHSFSGAESEVTFSIGAAF